MTQHKNVANKIDAHVGRRVRLRRTMMGLSQEKLGQHLGLTFQQVQKYERGLNRIGASRLFDIAQTLDVPVGFFFDDMPEEVAALAHRQQHDQDGGHPQHRNLDSNILLTRETSALLRAFRRITDPEVRRRTLELLRTIARRLNDD